jgi:hypothetical protein
MAKLLRLGWILAFSCAALAYPLYGLFSLTAKEVIFVTPFDEKTVRINRGLFKLDTPDRNAPDWKKKVMGIYGLPNDQADRVLFVPESRLTRPAEDPSIVFMTVDKDRGENPWQLKTFLFVAKWGSIATAGAGAALLGIWALLRKKSAPPPAPAA